MYHGWLLLDKQVGVSSAAAIQVLKSIFKPLKVGHAGTLDPFASGLLLVAIGEATKLIEYAVVGEKAYNFTVTWGEEKDTLDICGNTTDKCFNIPTQNEIIEAIPEFLGEISQKPPKYSAIKVQGNRSYKLARENKDFELSSRPVLCNKLELINGNSSFYLECGKGFYVRALARDLAYRLNTLAYVSSLRRMKIGKFLVADAITIDYIEELLINFKCNPQPDQYIENYKQIRKNKESLAQSLFPKLIPIHAVLDDILVFHVSEDQAKKIKHGQTITILDDQLTDNCDVNNEQEIVKAFFDDKLIAICRYSNGVIIPKKVFNL